MQRQTAQLIASPEAYVSWAIMTAVGYLPPAITRLIWFAAAFKVCALACMHAFSTSHHILPAGIGLSCAELELSYVVLCCVVLCCVVLCCVVLCCVVLCCVVLCVQVTLSMSNLPGPAQPLTFAGADVSRFIFFVPPIRTIGHFLCILSYANSVVCGLACDERLVSAVPATRLPLCSLLPPSSV